MRIFICIIRRKKDVLNRFWGYRLGNYYWLMEFISLVFIYIMIMKESSIVNFFLVNEKKI